MKDSIKDFDKVHRYYDWFMKVFGLYREKEISKILKLKGFEKVLDIGGGTGYLAAHLIKECREYHVLDESELMLSHVPMMRGIHRVLGDALDLPFENEGIDIVILSDVLHHIKEQGKLINESLRVLKPSGKLLIHDFDIRYLRTKILRGFENKYFSEVYFKSIDEVDFMVRDKFRLIYKKSQGYYFILLGEK